MPAQKPQSQPRPQKQPQALQTQTPKATMQSTALKPDKNVAVPKYSTLANSKTFNK
jgi:hypothetical protein